MRKAIWGLGIVCACGGGSSGATQPQPAASTSSTSATPSAMASTPPAPSASAAANDDAYDDPNESAQAISMEPLVTAKAKPTYPKATSSDGDCWKTVSFSGQHDKDWTALIDKCGAPTGMVEYVKPQQGKLHHIKDVSDSFTVPMTKSQCYRLFAVADSTIHDIDIVILRNGSILGMGKMSQPVEIIDGSAPFCPETDGTYSFDVKIKGDGKGAYTFGIWTRPKK